MRLNAYQNHTRLPAFAGWLLLLWLMAPTAVADTRSGIDWLLAQQHSHGSYWTDADLATAVQSTAEALRTLYELGQGAHPGITGAELSLAQTRFHNSEYLSRKIISAIAAGQSAPQWIDELLSHQSADGGFGDRPGYQSTVLDSAYALEALAAAAIPDSGHLGRALDFLRARQGADGSWAQGGNGPSLYLTALAMHALWTHRHRFSVDPALDAAQGYLLQALGNGAEQELFITASVLLAVIPRLHDSASVADPLALLQNAQRADGSWGGVYTTALVLRVLALAGQAVPNPDLGTLAGRILDAATSLPLAGVTVTLEGPLHDTRTTATDGVFQFQALPGGDYRLTLALADYAVLSAATRLPAGETLDFGELTLIPGANPATGTLRGTVTDADTGLPLGGVSVATDQGADTVTAVDGSYRIGDLAPGQITVTALFTGYRSASGRATLSAGAVFLFSPALRPDIGLDSDDQASLSGQITAAATALPLEGVSIRVAGATSATVQSDAEGRFRIAPLNPGPHDIDAHLAGYDPVTAGMLVFAGQPVDFSPALYPQATTPPGANTAQINGTVVDAATREPLPGVSVTATHGGHTEVSITGSDGRFTASGISDAELQLDFALDGYRPITFALPIEPLAARDIGAVRMWSETLQALLPDLSIRSIDTAIRTTDPHTLVVGGALEAVIVNQGSAPASDGFAVLAFHDADLDGLYRPGTDLPLGRASFPGTLAIGEAGRISIPLEGRLPFTDAPIGLQVDSALAVPELDEDNNLRSTASDCSLVEFEPGERFDLSAWAAEDIPGAGGGGPARWTLDANNTRVTQEINNYSSLYLSDFDFSDGHIGGTIQVDTNSDDDHIGLIWGYQDERHYYLLYWAYHHSLMDYHLTVRKVDSTQLYPLSDATILYHGAPSWEHHVVYDYVLDFRPGGFALLIKQDGAVVDDIVIEDDRYISGKFGFYDHSQPMARFTARPHREISTPVPDLTVGRPQLIDNGAGQPLSLMVHIGNSGGPMESGRTAQVGFYHGDPDAGGVLLGTLPFDALNPGQYTELRLDGLGDLAGGELFAVVDPPGAIDECSKANNRVSLPLSSTPARGSLEIGTDAAVYGPNTPVAPWARVHNGGSFAADYRVQLGIEDSAGATVVEFPEQALSALPAATHGILTQSWGTGTTLAGDYVLHGRLYDSERRLLDEATAAFVLQPGSGPRVSLRTTTDRPRYHTSDRVEIGNLVRNLTANTLIEGIRLHLSITDPADRQIHQQTIALGQLPAGAARERSSAYVLTDAPSGAYRAEGRVLDRDGTPLATAAAGFEVRHAPEQGLPQGLSGEVVVEQSRLSRGTINRCTDRLTNLGRQGGLAVRVRTLLVRLDSGAVVHQSERPVVLAGSETRSEQRIIRTAALAAGDYGCLLQARLDRSDTAAGALSSTQDVSSWQTLDFARFTLIDPSGVVYDARSRGPLAGVRLSLVDAGGTPLPEVCLGAGQQGQFSGADGAYHFDLSPGADSRCPAAESEYRIALFPPPGYRLSEVIVPQPGTLDPGGGPGPYLVAPQATAPAPGEPTTYYLGLRLAAGDPAVVNNHIPLDRQAVVASVSIPMLTPWSTAALALLLAALGVAANRGGSTRRQ